VPGLKFTDKTEEARSLRDALAGHVARYTVAIVPETGADLGTGVLLSSGNGLYIATTRHVAELLALDKVFVIPRSDSPLKIVKEDEIAQHLRDDRPIDRFRISIEDRFMSANDEDVAILRLRKRPEELRWMNFYPLERASSTPPRHRQVFVYGYAWELTRVQRTTGQAKVISRVTLGELRDRDPLPYDPGRDLLISYDRGDMNPKGMSGGGIWYPPSLGKKLFNPGGRGTGPLELRGHGPRQGMHIGRGSLGCGRRRGPRARLVRTQ